MAAWFELLGCSDGQRSQRSRRDRRRLLTRSQGKGDWRGTNSQAPTLISTSELFDLTQSRMRQKIE